MNLQELKQQAGIKDNPDQEGLDLFAELIVRECADACYKHKDVESFGIYPVRVAMVTKACSDNIKEHFGVQE